MSQSGRTIICFAAIRLAAVGALAATLVLAGCGRKGALDPPPGTSAQPPVAEQQSGGAAGQAANPTMDYGSDSRPVAPRGQNKKLPIDVLID